MGGRHAELTLDGELRESQPRPPQSPLSQVLGRVSQSTTFLSFISCFIINFMLAGGHSHRAGDSEHVGDQVVDLLPGGVGAGPPAGAEVEVEEARVGQDLQDLIRLPAHLTVVVPLIIFLTIS